MTLQNKILVFLRIFLGGVLMFSGGQKVLSPYQNFLYVIQHYEMFPINLEILAAQTMPWIELLVGLFVVLGLWLNLALRGQMILYGAFIVVISQALIRKLPIDDCGCFGEAISIPPHVTLIFDSISFVITALMIKNISLTNKFSLDRFFLSRG